MPVSHLSNKERHAWLNCDAPFHSDITGQVTDRAVHADFPKYAFSAEAMDAVLIKSLSFVLCNKQDSLHTGQKLDNSPKQCWHLFGPLRLYIVAHDVSYIIKSKVKPAVITEVCTQGCMRSLLQISL